MDGKIPLPTDNIYKFYALFGILLFISSMAASLYLHKTTNELIFEIAVLVEELETKENPTRAEIKKREMAEKRVEIAVKDRKDINLALSLLFTFSGLLVTIGFWKWQTEVQPKQDRLLDLQIEKAEQELKKPERFPLRGPKR